MLVSIALLQAVGVGFAAIALVVVLIFVSLGGTQRSLERHEALIFSGQTAGARRREHHGRNTRSLFL
jgi:hypothetical protein